MAATRKFLSTDDEFRQAVAESLLVRQVPGCIGLVPTGGNSKVVYTHMQRVGLGTGHFTGWVVTQAR